MTYFDYETCPCCFEQFSYGAAHDCPPTSEPIANKPTEIVLDDINPRRLISANRRIHHFLRSEVCADWRKKAHDAAVAAYGVAEVGEAWHEQVRIVITFRFPDLRRHDVGNLYPYVAKPLVDGLVDARILRDDDDKHVIGPDLRRDHERGPHRITIRITDQGDS